MKTNWQVAINWPAISPKKLSDDFLLPGGCFYVHRVQQGDGGGGQGCKYKIPRETAGGCREALKLWLFFLHLLGRS